MPRGAVYVGRPSKWGNPFVKHGDGHPMAAAVAVDCFRSMLIQSGAWWPIPLPWPKGKIPATTPTTVEDVKRELRGKDLACWCPLDQPCHADVLLELANGLPRAPKE
jgi:hypothetical protein